MELKSEEGTKRGCYSDGCMPRTEPTGCTRAISLLDQNSSTSRIAHSPVFTLSNEERKALEAHKLQVEERRSIAIKNARRITYV